MRVGFFRESQDIQQIPYAWLRLLFLFPTPDFNFQFSIFHYEQKNQTNILSETFAKNGNSIGIVIIFLSLLHAHVIVPLKLRENNIKAKLQ